MILKRAEWIATQPRVSQAKCDEAGDCATGGNFRGVCPVIGRLRICCAAYIAAVMESAGKRRSFFMARNDTHGLAYKDSRPYPEQRKTEYDFKEETTTWQTRK